MRKNGLNLEHMDTTEHLTTSFIESPEAELQTVPYMKNARQIEQNGLALHAAIHGKNGYEGLDSKTYHDVAHPLTLEQRARNMARVLGLSHENYAIIRMAIAFHDTVIAYDPAGSNKLTGTIRRHRGAKAGDNRLVLGKSKGNEQRSAELLEEEMRNAVPPFSDEQIQIAKQCIEATYVEVERDKYFTSYPDYQTLISQNTELGGLIDELSEQNITTGLLISQIHLERALEKGPVRWEVIITALADLGAAGLASKEEFFEEGDREAQELYGNLRDPDTIKRLLTGKEQQDQEDRKEVAGVLTDWLDGQASFALFQALRFERVVYLLKEHEQIPKTGGEEEQALRGQFSNFTENIAGAADRATQLKQTYNTQISLDEKQAFYDLIKSMHFPTLTRQ